MQEGASVAYTGACAIHHTGSELTRWILRTKKAVILQLATVHFRSMLF